MMPQRGRWDGVERRSGTDRRKGQERRMDIAERRRRATRDGERLLGDPRAVIEALRQDRRTGHERRRQVLSVVKESVKRHTQPAFHAFLDAHPEAREALQRRLSEHPDYEQWLRGLGGTVLAALERKPAQDVGLD